ncbi:MAG TPA: hypothetical protein VGZ47_16470 [Gemmataceae bacterium]|jgi:hypothetical protein|nr:hypothetical protein [Gemmataceae bacterium]
MTVWNGKEKLAMAAASSKPNPERGDSSSFRADKPMLHSVSAKPEAEPAHPSPVEAEDRINLSMNVWVLRLWVLAALVIITYAICNYLASWWAK